MEELTKYEWYELVKGEDSILQGDIIEDCPLLLLSPKTDSLKDEVFDSITEIYRAIVLSQSCDLVAKKIQNVVLCPLLTLTEFSENNNTFKKPGEREKIRKGNYIGLHMLNRHTFDGIFSKGEFFVVDFRKAFSLNYDFLSTHIKKYDDRLRLLPPYREHLSQAFARSLMRIGLPADIPPFK